MHPELVSAATTVVASTGDVADFERFVEGFQNAPGTIGSTARLSTSSTMCSFAWARGVSLRTE